jgi:Transglutaminase-like superfamily
MSKLYYTEMGHVLPTLSEELTSCRRARKVLELPGTQAPATLYVLARPYAGSEVPLRISVNGIEINPLQPAWVQAQAWHTVTLPPSLLRPGANTFEFWNDAPAMDAWSLAIEGGHREPASYRSDDGGQHWRNQKMSYLNILTGEYVVRVRLEEGEDPAPPTFVWEDPRSPRLAQLRQRLPAEALQPGPVMKRVRALTYWLSTSWQHTDAKKAQQYAPWDAETILAWGRVRTGQDGRLPVVMCVHYGAAFVSCAQAAGLRARTVITADTINGYCGHFVAEVWFDEYHKWVLVDPNLDAIFRKAGVPLSVREVQAAGAALGELVEWGRGTEFQRRYPNIEAFVHDNYLTGVWIRSRSNWARADFLSRPDLTPPGHGMTAYCETSLVWDADLRSRGFGMFPYFGNRDYFETPPDSAG